MSASTKAQAESLRSPRHRTLRREEILQGAAGLFAQHGYDAVSLADIADAVGLSKPTLYHYFDRKEAILVEIVRWTIEHLDAHVGEAVSRHVDPVSKMAALLDAQAEFFERNQHAFQVLLSGVGSLRGQDLRELAWKWGHGYEGLIRRIVRDGVAAGVFRAECQSGAVQAVLASLYWLARRFRPGRRKSARDIARAYGDVILNGMRTASTD